MWHKIRNLAKPWQRAELLLLFIVLLSIFMFPSSGVSLREQFQPQVVYDYRLRMQHAEVDKEVSVSVYLPRESARQELLNQAFQSPALQHHRFTNAHGSIGNWRGEGLASTIDYRALVRPKAYRFELSSEIPLIAESRSAWPQTLSSTAAIQSDHPEIAQLWQTIKPEDSTRLLPAIKSIYDYVEQLETLPFKGMTDALTAMRLGAASCNGKSRLFVALARHIGVPARLVGGVILNEGRKRTSHQWLEVNINQQWVPFDPTNGYFAEIPAHYLEFYVGDVALFKHTTDIGFDYFFDISPQSVAPALYYSEAEQPRSIALTRLLNWLAIPAQTTAIFLTLPLCALIIVSLRNLVGLKSFGVFLPLLISGACAFIGLLPGLLGMTLISVLGVLCHLCLVRLNILKVPRLAAVITVVNLATLGLLFAFKQLSSVHAGLLSLFPVIILSFVADKLSELVDEGDWVEILKSLGGTLVMVLLCYACMTSATVLGVLVIYPELFVLIIAAQIFLGRWRGLRVSELIRFHRLLKSGANVLGINRRNLDYVSGLNQSQDLSTAVDKLATKSLLQKQGIPCPATLARYSDFQSLEDLGQDISGLNEFVLKPNSGSQGSGILVIKGRRGQEYVSAGGRCYTANDMRSHAHEIISGHFAQHGSQDTAYIEPLIHQHTCLNAIAGSSLCDIRVVVIKGKIVNAMLRIPTRHSNGKANLHQGALGAAIDLKEGRIRACFLRGKPIEKHPDSGMQITGVCLPHWSEILEISGQCSKALGLGYLGVDICLDDRKGPLVLELNGRPGLEIQNITQRSLLQASVLPAI